MGVGEVAGMRRLCGLTIKPACGLPAVCHLVEQVMGIRFWTEQVMDARLWACRVSPVVSGSWC